MISRTTQITQTYPSIREQAMPPCSTAPAADLDKVRGTTDEMRTARPPSVTPKALSADELQSFMRQPELLHGRKFLMSPDKDDEAMFEVVSYMRARDKTFRFEILFEDCGDSPLIVEQEEMNSLMEESYIYPSSSS